MEPKHSLPCSQKSTDFKTWIFWVITQRVVVITYRRFGTPCRSQIKVSRFKLSGYTLRVEVPSWPLNMWPTGCREMAVKNYHYSLRNDPEECSSQLLRGGSLNSRTAVTFHTLSQVIPRCLIHSWSFMKHFITFPSTPTSSKRSFSFRFLSKPYMKFCSLPHTCHTPEPSQPLQFDYSNNICLGVQALRGHVGTQLVKARRYKPEGRRFDSRLVSLEFFIDILLPAALWLCL
jgi:hypothetical protein